MTIKLLCMKQKKKCKLKVSTVHNGTFREAIANVPTDADAASASVCNRALSLWTLLHQYCDMKRFVCSPLCSLQTT